MNVKSLSDVRLVATPWTAAYQAPPSVGFSRQEYWNGGAIAFSELDFLVPIKSTTTIAGVGEGVREKEKKSKRIYRASQNIRIINVFLESLLPESFPSLGVTVHLTSLGCPPTLC